jgi:hypothetical protein
MLPVYSTNFFTGNLGTSYPLLYAVTAEQVIVLRDVELFNGGTSSSSFSIFVVTPGAQVTILYSNDFAVDTSLQWQGRVVIEGGGALHGGSGNGLVQACISGYLLSAA